MRVHLSQGPCTDTTPCGPSDLRLALKSFNINRTWRQHVTAAGHRVAVWERARIRSDRADTLICGYTHPHKKGSRRPVGAISSLTEWANWKVKSLIFSQLYFLPLYTGECAYLWQYIVFFPYRCLYASILRWLVACGGWQVEKSRK